MTQPRILQRERDTIVQALKSGVVPRLGLRHLQVGRAREVAEMVKDMERIRDAGASIRFLIGEYGAGKTFFLNLTRLVALEKGIVTMSADLGPDKRLHASAGQGRALFAEMARSIATRTYPDGGALDSILQRFIMSAAREGDTHKAILERLAHLEELVGGFDFARVVARYWEGHEKGDDLLRANALRWMRAEFVTRTDARKALGVRTIIDDRSFYDHLKLFAAFVREAGYQGLVVVLDEMVNLYKLTNRQARDSNYEQILRVLNDVLQGNASHIGFLLGGTPEFLMDTRRGLYSYPALQSRLSENTFAREGLVDLTGPIIRLQNLSPEHLYVLLLNIRRVFAGGDENNLPVPDEAIEAFMAHCAKRIGDAYFRTPRNTVTQFVNFLSVLEQNPDARWQQLIDKVQVQVDTGSGSGGDNSTQTNGPVDDELATFRL